VRGELRPKYPVGRRTLSAARQKGLELGIGKAGQGRPVPAKQVGSTIRSAIADYGDTGTAQRLEVAEDGASRHLDPASEFSGAHPAMSLEQEKDRKKAVCTHLRKLFRR